MKTAVVLPLLKSSAESEPDGIGGPAAIREVLSAASRAGLSYLALDQQSLEACLDSIGALCNALQNPNRASIKLAEVGLTLGVSSSGKVGFFGSGAELELACEIELTFQLSDRNTPLGSAGVV